ncbi:MAG: pantetheine-phosphate adenylyltransferase [Chloroflexi bacterium HGW-Chloroflexi-5]|jgi:pantetheine-phosphate adenylyltransferase|nr:MAG: pantetheine-phosphate adenylyltransferase [Chloroflexi bacterium HGW-Chloroflexi-5]
MLKAVFPGSFDPIHNGHIDIANRAANLVDELVIAVFDKPLKNFLLSPEERISLVKGVFKDNPKVTVCGYSGLTVKFCELIGAKVMIRGLRVFSDFEFEFRMALANHRLTQNVEMMALITSEEHTFLSSSTVREIASLGGDISTMVPKSVEEILKKKLSNLGDNNPIVPGHTLRD